LDNTEHPHSMVCIFFISK